MTRSFVPFWWGVGLGIGMCLGWSFIGYYTWLGGLPKFFVTYARYFWPSSLFLRNPALEHNPGLLSTLLALSVVANALLYGVLFVAIAFVVRKFRDRKSKRLTMRSSEPPTDEKIST